MDHTFPSRFIHSRLGHPRSTPDLVARLVAHDDAAFQELVLAHGPRMLAVATRYLRVAADAEDAVQDAFVNVVRSIASFKRDSSLETWLHRIVVNCSLMQLRRRRRKPTTPLSDGLDLSTAVSPRRQAAEASAHDTFAAREQSLLLRAAVDLLPHEQRAVLLLRDVEALSVLEIGVLLQLRVSTVKWRLLGAHRALRIALRGQLAECRG